MIPLEVQRHPILDSLHFGRSDFLVCSRWLIPSYAC